MTVTPFSRSHECLDCWKRLENCLSAPFLLKEQMDFDHICTFRLLGHVKELVTLTPFSRSHDGLDGWKMACLHPISWMNGLIFTKLVHLYCWDMEKNWLDFSELDPIFMVTGELRLLENGLPASYLMKEWMDFDQTCTTILLWHETSYFEISRPWWLSWMRRPTGDQEVAGSTPAKVGNILSWRLIMKYFLRSFSPFPWFKKGSCQFLAKECAQYWLTA